MTQSKQYTFGQTMECPVCGKVLLAAGMRNHINGRAKVEVYNWYMQGRDIAVPHQDYIENNLLPDKFKIKI